MNNQCKCGICQECNWVNRQDELELLYKDEDEEET